jgi:phage terminase Nu1 subunit (DNA packaging protein)
LQRHTLNMARRERSLEDLLGAKPAKADGRRNNRGAIAPHRVRLATAQAELTELRTAKLRGELIPAPDVAAEWSAILTDCRQRMLAVASRVAARLGLDREQTGVVDEEIRGALLALSASGGVSDAGDTE